MYSIRCCFYLCFLPNLVPQLLSFAILYLHIKNKPDCSTIVTTTDDEGLEYGDGIWHHFVAKRIYDQGSLSIDDRWTGNVS